MNNDTTPPPEPRSLTHVVADEDEGERADVVLGRRIPALSRRQARALARAGKLRVEGRRQPPATRVRAGQRLELDLRLSEDRDAPTLDELEILATSDDFVYVLKPAGVHTVALTPAQPGVLATALAARFPECADASEDPREGGAIHRLDRPTSGVVAFARSRATWERARAGFRDERFAKHYLAVCTALDDAAPWPPPLPEGGLRGWIDPLGPASALDEALAAPGLEPLLDALQSGSERLPDLAGDAVRIRAAIGPDGPRRSAVRLDGRRASTVVVPLAHRGSQRLVRLVLETGLRHQARVHLSWVNLPILGDRKYGRVRAQEGSTPGTAIHLHACAIDLSAVFPGERPIYTDPPPGFWPPA
ncbi:Ribosomal large subunit pseudouridine synthase D [Enhygromyxa salina]|uniref:Ribosomal large subunit pseudouridine synthase D n=1 Tax=Enhygromyxa salina TaxID=215803 RepID=A0A2S9XBW8_9BACT|nr:RNA pseudouridine synthase [Enhygromyxa salina]PRP90353.1 Ribosomal large subunit pseudouridine synthase D [Enhygromyxa salina]